jgi:uncharacterized protein (DUF1697 family)
MPTNAKMPELRQAFEAAGFSNVKTVLSSGNVAFDTRETTETSLQQRAETAMARQLGQAFFTIVRPVEALQQMLASDPYRDFHVSPSAKRIVTFLRDDAPDRLALPIEQDGTRLLALRGRELFSTYERTPKGPVFMTPIERALGKAVTTRTWETVVKVAKA